jgi:hypothetical protein
MSFLHCVCLLLTISTFISSVFGTEYWISVSTGSDNNNGKSITAPFRSINRIYSERLVSGDFVHLCKGDRWAYTMISHTVSGVTWDSYSCRADRIAKPQVTPAIDLDYTKWRTSPNDAKVLVYDMTGDSAALSSGIRSLWAGQVRYSLARWPNLLDPVSQVTWGQVGEFAQMQSITGTTLRSTAITQPAGYFTGTRLHFRQANWLYFDAYITASQPGQMTLNANWATQPNFYYFVEANFNGKYSNNLQLLDQVGEYVFDVASKAIYLIPMTEEARVGILNGTVPVSALYGNVGTAASLTQPGKLIGLELTMSAGGIWGTANDIVIQNCTISNVLAQGFAVSGWRNNIKFMYNDMYDVEGTCVEFSSTTGVVAYNKLNGCGLYGRNSATWNGVSIGGGLVAYNEISNCGYTCVAPHYASTVDSNIITNSMMTLNDGGAIYTYGSSDNGAVITNNIIKNVYGNFASWFPARIASCIYQDEGTYGSRIQNNTCSGDTQQCVFLHRCFSHSILMNSCQSPGIYQVEGSGHQIAGNLVRTSGTDGTLQNPLFRMYTTQMTNYNGMFNVWDQLYCSTAPSNNYIYQRQTIDGTWRYNNFNEWVAAERVFNPNFEASSQLWADCEGLKPIDINAADPWAFAVSSSSSSTGVSSSAVSSSAQSSSAVSSSAASSSAMSSSVMSSSAQSSSAASSTAVSSSSTASIMSSSSVAARVPSYPLGGCTFRGPYNLVAASVNFTATMRDLDINAGPRFMEEVAAWGSARGFDNIYLPTANPMSGIYCVPIIQKTRGSTEQYGLDATYAFTVWLINDKRALDFATQFNNMIRTTGFTGQSSGVTALITSTSVALQQCPRGVTVPIPKPCPASSSSAAPVVKSSSTGSAAPADDSNKSTTASVASAGGVAAIIIACVCVSAILIAAVVYHRYRKSRSNGGSGNGLFPWSNSSPQASPQYSPTSSPLAEFNGMDGCAPPSPGLEIGVPMHTFSLDQTSDVEEKSSHSLALPAGGNVTISPSMSSAPFLGIPVSPIGTSSTTYSPSQSCAMYQAMPNSPGSPMVIGKEPKVIVDYVRQIKLGDKPEGGFKSKFGAFRAKKTATKISVTQPTDASQPEDM